MPQSQIPFMLAKLDKLYDKQDQLKKSIEQQYKMLEQINEDIEMLENMIMYKSNKMSRGFDNGIIETKPE